MFFSAFGFDLFFLLFVIVFVVVLVRNLREWSRNNASPRLSVPATVVTKRRAHSHNAGTQTSSTTYYATFQFESGDRLELRLPWHDAGMIAEGDHGILHFQGTRYLGFDRDQTT
ncbi:DUF2500 domain-containing protein [Subdoligranulum variabile]|uniref:DUF2500 domain-containing protein n=1 Tax=Subdoligranulum variabile DSM 15176 TaxID=411471 RepID=D1PNQ6_9FIRM|nr:DUF2500 domain-containing protein [Subdoligranulum variabile]EFB76191.1 hypothetical protein SUBVAR_05977 [Subdoligranulum variabile DSM 15176]UWP68825.1 DUF2500 domain-containing protein [Subdoligranulum variabile]